MADPAPAAPPSPSPAPASPAPAARPGGLTGVRYDQPISDQAFDRLGPQEQSKFARVRNQNNDPEWQPRTDLAPSPAPKPAAAPGEAAPPAPAPAGDKIKVGQYETSESEIRDLLQFKADRLAAQVGVPPAAQDYVIKTPADWRAIDGVEFQIDANAPAFADLKNWAHKNSIPQGEVETLIGLYASYEAQKEAAFRTAVQREKELLGARGTMRIDSLHSWLRSVIQDDDLTGAVMQGLWSSKQVLALERIAAKHTSQGAAPYSQAHRTPEPLPGPGIASDAKYAVMSQAERWAYARSHSEARKNRSGER